MREELKTYPDQEEAINNAIQNKVSILTGAPGTGKSTVTKQIVQHFKEKGFKCALAAPSGRAAKRMVECTGFHATTIHRLLEPQFKGNKFFFTRNETNPLDYNFIVLDEVSMVDTGLMASFLEAVHPKTRLLFVGDSYQLPSVGAGNVLQDLIASGSIPKTELTIIKRQDEGLIIRNAHRIKNGLDIELENSHAKDFFFLQRNSEKEIKETILDIALNRFPKAFSVDFAKDIQVIVPLREKTELSCKLLNQEFQKQCGGKELLKNIPFRLGDKVIQVKNDYQLDVMNGDIGFVTGINPKKKHINVLFENPSRQVEIPLYGHHLELAYAITCHKAQGSESPIIIIPIHRSFGPLILQRNWLYTAITRAKKICVLVGQREEIPKIIQRNHQQKRFTRLAEVLK